MTVDFLLCNVILNIPDKLPSVTVHCLDTCVKKVLVTHKH